MWIPLETRVHTDPAILPPEGDQASAASSSPAPSSSVPASLAPTLSTVATTGSPSP